MPISIYKQHLERRIGASEVAKFSRGSDEAVNAAIAQAWDSARSAALNTFTAESWDALTEETLPDEAELHITSHAIDILSSGNNRLAEIERKADEAAKWRGYLVGNKVRCFDGVLVQLLGDYGGVTYSAPARTLVVPWVK